MTNWRSAKSIDILCAQVNALYPGRDKSSDGGIGNAEHASRSSDHNPWVTDRGVGVVTARDITHDPRHSCDAGVIAGVLIASRDPRIKYIIWNRQIIAGDAGPSPWKWRKYTGSNPHTMHVHISVKSSKSFYDDPRPWAMPGAIAPKVPSAPQPPKPRPTLLRGSTGDGVKELQRLLGVEVDGMFGPKTEAAVKAFQRKSKLGADGIAGQYTWAALTKK